MANLMKFTINVIIKLSTKAMKRVHPQQAIEFFNKKVPHFKRIIFWIGKAQKFRHFQAR
jgi:hypothetical protein